jgi:hypothetical protein
MIWKVRLHKFNDYIALLLALFPSTIPFFCLSLFRKEMSKDFSKCINYSWWIFILFIFSHKGQAFGCCLFFHHQSMENYQKIDNFLLSYSNFCVAPFLPLLYWLVDDSFHGLMNHVANEFFFSLSVSLAQ